MKTDIESEVAIFLNAFIIVIISCLSQVQSLTCITEARIEYVNQETERQLLNIEYKLELDDSVFIQFSRHLEWWHGERGTQGVDIEDCWKCTFCIFQGLCEWREHCANKLLQK